MKKIFFYFIALSILAIIPAFSNATVQCPSNTTPALQVSDPACWTTYTSPGYYTTTTILCTWGSCVPSYLCCNTYRGFGDDFYSECVSASSPLSGYESCKKQPFSVCTNTCGGVALDSCGNEPSYPRLPADYTKVVSTYVAGTTSNICYYTTVASWSLPDATGKRMAMKVVQHSAPGSSCVSQSNVSYVSVAGSCGTRNTTYESNVNVWPAGSTFCSSGTSFPNNTSFPAVGSTRSWECLGVNGGSTSNCFAKRKISVINGVCGTRSTTYSSEITEWPAGSTFCSSGISFPKNPYFPAVGSTRSWECKGSGGGLSQECTAGRRDIPMGVKYKEGML